MVCMLLTPETCMQAYEKATRSHDLEGTLTLIADEAVYFFSDETVYTIEYSGLV